MIVKHKFDLFALLRHRSILFDYLHKFKQLIFVGFVLAFFIANVIVSATLFQKISKQSELLTEQQKSFAQLAVLQNRLQVANDQAATNANSLAQLQTAIKELTKATETSRVLGSSITKPLTFAEEPSTLLNPAPLGIVMVNTLNPVDKVVYDTPEMLKHVETVKPGIVMLYYKKMNDWYQVDPPSHFEKKGWIQKDNLTEVPNVSELPH